MMLNKLNITSSFSSTQVYCYCVNFASW